MPSTYLFRFLATEIEKVHMVVKIIIRKKLHKTVKRELLKSLRENDTVEEPEFIITNVNNPRELMTIINHYDEIIKTQNKKARYLAIQGQMLTKFKDMEEFTEIG